MESTNTDKIRDRLTALNTKAYYLLVALSFVYSKATNPSCSLKWALVLTAVVAVLPLQDFVKIKILSRWEASLLEGFRWFKVVCLVAALVFFLKWVWWS